MHDVKGMIKMGKILTWENKSISGRVGEYSGVIYCHQSETEKQCNVGEIIVVRTGLGTDIKHYLVLEDHLLVDTNSTIIDMDDLQCRVFLYTLGCDYTSEDSRMILKDLFSDSYKVVEESVFNEFTRIKIELSKLQEQKEAIAVIENMLYQKLRELEKF